jgi:hypothetical protein
MATRRRALTLAPALFALALFAAPRPAAAALGANADSVAADQAHLSGTLRSIGLASYELHEIQAATGTLVREFAVPGGPVFAVTWEGPFLPNLRQLLGASYDAYVHALRAKRRGRGPLLIQLPDLVFESAGHPRGFHGRAYVPQLVPDGVATEAIR